MKSQNFFVSSGSFSSFDIFGSGEYKHPTFLDPKENELYNLYRISWDFSGSGSIACFYMTFEEWKCKYYSSRQDFDSIKKMVSKGEMSIDRIFKSKHLKLDDPKTLITFAENMKDVEEK